jgi:hypothetical protein
LSGNVHLHAGTAEGMRASSPFDIKVIRINTQIFCSFCIVQQLCIVQYVLNEIVDFRVHNKTHFFQIIFRYIICYGLLRPFGPICQYVTAQSMYIKGTL